jgi:peptidoglycan hydrolase-like protein with peptidoglycan-binding domain
MSVQKPLIGFAGLSSLASQIPDQVQVKEPPESEEKYHSSRFKWEATDPKNAETEASKAPSSEAIAPSPPPSTGSKLKNTVAIAVLLTIGFALIRAVSDNKPQTSPSYSTYTPPPATSRNSPSQPALPVLPVVPPPTYSEMAPEPGDGTRTLNRENIRWCLYQGRRLENIRSIIMGSQTPGDVPSFNATIDDFNRRCGKYRYYKNDMASVNAEISLKELDLQSQATQIVGNWRRQNSQLLPKQLESPPRPTSPFNSPPPTSSDVDASPARPNSIPIDGAPSGVQALDLLDLQDATSVQKRLAELGFLSIPPNGIWGPRSRQALRDFKLANGLPPDDAWDHLTNEQLFSSTAEKKTTVGTGTKPPGPIQSLDTSYPPPPGTTLNPLNRSDAINLQQRLAALGFFVGKSDGLWGLASRDALRKFKVAAGLTADDQWNSEAETALKNGLPGRANESNELFVGGWAQTVADCEESQAGDAPFQITARRAEATDYVCTYAPPQPEGSGSWRIKAACRDSKRSWNSNIKIVVAGDRLSWSTEKGQVSFVRCKGN